MNESDFIERELNLLMDEMSNLHINEFNFDDYAEEEEESAASESVSTDGECVCGESGELCLEGSESLDEDLEGEEDFEDTEEDPQAFFEE